MKPAGSRSQKGFTLVELMIALVLGLLVVLGVSQVYLTTLQSSRAIADIAARQEVVSYFTHVVGNEVRSSSTVYPVDGNVPAATSGHLQVNYTSGAPPFSELYCPASEDLEALEYYSELDTVLEDSFLVVVPFCSDSGSLGAHRVVSGVSGLVFDSGADDRYVDVVMTLASFDKTFSSAAVTKNKVEMRMVSHSAMIFE